jgi:hypothetical protein
MERATPVDLDEIVRKWRMDLERSGAFNPEELNELELHLRDSINRLKERGVAPEEAFWLARKRLGGDKTLEVEFAKERGKSQPSKEQARHRIVSLERNFFLPIKAFAIIVFLFSFFNTPWFRRSLGSLEVGLRLAQNFLLVYIAINGAWAVLLAAQRKVSFSVMRYGALATSLVDVVFVTALGFVTGENDILFWGSVALILRNAVTCPGISTQVLVNLCVIVAYTLGGLVGLGIVPFLGDVSSENIDLQGVVLRLVILTLLSACCQGVDYFKNRKALQVA